VQIYGTSSKGIWRTRSVDLVNGGECRSLQISTANASARVGRRGRRPADAFGVAPHLGRGPRYVCVDCACGCAAAAAAGPHTPPPTSMLCRPLVWAVVPLLVLQSHHTVALAAPTPLGWENSTMITVYRVTPITVEGCADMDTADAPGDVYFGLSQLLLPYACGDGGGNSLWCANRKWLSGGTAWMVYRKFEVQARLPMGEYARCNPSRDTGKFSCSSSSGGGGNLPKSCGNATVGYDEHHSRYVNGTVYHTMQLAPTDNMGRCCKFCTAGGTACYGWQYSKAAGNGSGITCSFIGSDGYLVGANPHNIGSVQKVPRRPNPCSNFSFRKSCRQLSAAAPTFCAAGADVSCTCLGS
jgi:hypothetical protein